MKTSESIKNIAVALSNFQKDVGIVHKDATNPFHKKKYATLLSNINASSEALEKHGLAIVQGGMQGSPELATRLIHISGEWIEVYTPLVWDKPTMQNVGSALSYARRYGWQGVLALAASDDDGNAATGLSNEIPEFRPAAKQQATSQAPTGALGDTLIKFGKMKGKKFSEIPGEELHSYACWLKANAEKDGKPQADIVTQMFQYLEGGE